MLSKLTVSNHDQTGVRLLASFEVPRPFGETLGALPPAEASSLEFLGAPRLLGGFLVIGKLLLAERGFRFRLREGAFIEAPGPAAGVQTGLRWQALDATTSASHLFPRPDEHGAADGLGRLEVLHRLRDEGDVVEPLVLTDGWLAFIDVTAVPAPTVRLGVLDLETRDCEFHDPMTFAVDRRGVVAWNQGSELHWLDLRGLARGHHRLGQYGALRAIDADSLDVVLSNGREVLVVERSGHVGARWRLPEAPDRLILSTQAGVVVARSSPHVHLLHPDGSHEALDLPAQALLHFDGARRTIVAVRHGAWCEYSLDTRRTVTTTLPNRRVCDFDLERRLVLLDGGLSEGGSVLQVLQVLRPGDHAAGR